MKFNKHYEIKYTIPTLEQPGYKTALDFFNFNLVYVILKLLYIKIPGNLPMQEVIVENTKQ